MQEIEQIYTQYRQDVYRYLCSLTRDAALAEDLLSETFLRALTGLSGFRKGACVRTWLFSIARHVWIDGLRRKRHVLSGDELLARYVEEGGPGAPPFETQVDARALAARAKELLQTRRPPAGEVLAQQHAEHGLFVRGDRTEVRRQRKRGPHVGFSHAPLAAGAIAEGGGRAMKTQTERGIRFDISCEVCRDLMPLVRDGVASADSEALVRAHTERCGGCRTMLESETPPEHSMPDDARVLRRLRWRLLAQSVLFALVGVLGALWLTSRAGDVYLAWWLPLVGAACYYVLRRRCWLVPAAAAAFVLLYFFIPNMQSLQWGSVVLYASMALAVAGPLAIGCAIAGLLHFAFGNRKEEKYADGKKH